MPDIYVYLVDLPQGINEAVLKGADGYTVYISARLDDERARAAYRHALRHIENGDFDKSDVQRIESDVRKEL